LSSEIELRRGVLPLYPDGKGVHQFNAFNCFTFKLLHVYQRYENEKTRAHGRQQPLS
jgi:hypothetical protein